MQSDSIATIAGALSKFQSEIHPVIRDSFNPYFKSKYADLASIWQEIQVPLAKNGLSVFQGCIHTDGNDFLKTILMHSSGEYITSELKLYLSKQDAQGMGSAITYARRYALAAALGIVQEDDDANRAVTQIDKKDVETKSSYRSQFSNKQVLPSIGKDNMIRSSSPVVDRERTTSKDISTDEINIEMLKYTL